MNKQRRTQLMAVLEASESTAEFLTTVQGALELLYSDSTCDISGVLAALDQAVEAAEIIDQQS